MANLMPELMGLPYTFPADPERGRPALTVRVLRAIDITLDCSARRPQRDSERKVLVLYAWIDEVMSAVFVTRVTTNGQAAEHYTRGSIEEYRNGIVECEAPWLITEHAPT